VASRGHKDGATPARGAIGERVRAARERQGWNRETLAFHSGVSWAAIAQIESGRRNNLRLGTLTALADSLGVSIDYLVCGRAFTPTMLEHRSLLYASEDEFAAVVVPFLQQAVRRGEPALVVTTTENIALLRERLEPLTADGVEFVERSTWYAEPESTLEGYRSFLERSVDAGGHWVRIVGELVWKGRSESEASSWARYESLLNNALATAPATIICPYDTRALPAEIIDFARATHPYVIDREGIADSAEYSRAIGLLLER
jgi:transcriptional regulator with XRE-family HTH domain